MDLYGPLLANALFPAFEAARGRPTVPLTRYLRGTEQWSVAQLRELQGGLLRRLARHAYVHTDYYRETFDDAGVRPEDLGEPSDLARLPLLDRTTARATLASRTAGAPPYATIKKTTSGTSGQPVTVMYNAESRFWRDATKWRGYGWGGYHLGTRAFHYWGFGPPSASWVARRRTQLDRWIKRDLYVDCTPRGPAALAGAVAALRTFQPGVIVAYASGAAALARYVIDNRLRSWKPIPVLTGAERLLPLDRIAIEQAFGPAFETYGCREVMLIGSECAHHTGLHTSMETMIVELIVRNDDGTTRAAQPGETGEVAVTDLHNLACPMIRYLTGDLAVAHAETVCPCGRGLVRIGPVEGRVTETLHDGDGHPVGGLVFNVLFGVIGEIADTFQVVQRADRSVVLKLVPATSGKGKRGGVTPQHEKLIREFGAKYLPGVPFTIEYVVDIPLSAGGKRQIVIVERTASPSGDAASRGHAPTVEKP